MRATCRSGSLHCRTWIVVPRRPARCGPCSGASTPGRSRAARRRSCSRSHSRSWGWKLSVPGSWRTIGPLDGRWSSSTSTISGVSGAAIGSTVDRTTACYTISWQRITRTRPSGASPMSTYGRRHRRACASSPAGRNVLQRRNPRCNSLYTKLVNLYLIDQRGARNAQLLGRPRAIAAVELERLLDVHPLHLGEGLRLVPPLPPAPALAQIGRQVLDADLARPAGEDHRPLDDVAHLAHVAGPGRG